MQRRCAAQTLERSMPLTLEFGACVNSGNSEDTIEWHGGHSVRHPIHVKGKHIGKERPGSPWRLSAPAATNPSVPHSGKLLVKSRARLPAGTPSEPRWRRLPRFAGLFPILPANQSPCAPFPETTPPNPPLRFGEGGLRGRGRGWGRGWGPCVTSVRVARWQSHSENVASHCALRS